MPVLPGTQARLLPETSPSVASYRGGIAENAQGAVAEVTQQLGGEIIQMADKRRSELDDLRVIEAATDLRNKELKLTEEYKAIKGGKVLESKLLPTFTARFKEAADGVNIGLSPAQQKKFAGHMATASGNFQAGVLGYATHETEVYEGEVYGNALKSHEGMAAAEFRNDAQVNLQREGAREATYMRMNKLGKTDPVDRDQIMKGALGTINSSVIEAYLNATDTAGANAYFHRKDVQAEMTQDQIEKIEKRLKPATDFAAAKGIVDEVIQVKREHPDVNVADFIAEKAKGNPQIASDAHALYQHHFQQEYANNQDRLGTLMFAAEKGNFTPEAIAAIRTSKQYTETTDHNRFEFEKLVRQTQHQEVVENRSEVRFQSFENRQRAAEAKVAQQELWDSNVPMITALIENPQAFLKMSPGQLKALEPEIGPKRLKLLEAAQHDLSKQVNTVRIPADIFKGSIPSSFNKDKANTIKTLAALDIAEWQRKNGKAATPEVMADIVRQTAEETMPPSEHFFGPNKKAIVDVKDPTERLAYHELLNNFEGSATQPTREKLDSWVKKDKATLQATLSIMQRSREKGIPVTAEQIDTMLGKLSPATPATVTAPVGSKNTITPSAQKTVDQQYSEAFPQLLGGNPNTQKTLSPAQVKAAEIDRAKAIEQKNVDALERSIQPAPKREEGVVTPYPESGVIESAPLAPADVAAYEKTVEKAVAAPVPAPTSKGGDTTFAERGFTSQKGKLPLPATGGKPISTFSPAHTAKDNGGEYTVQSKGGRQVTVAAGTPIKAVAEGTIVFAGPIRGYDNVVIVKHGEYMTVYQNNEDVGVKKGDSVLKGSTIGSAKGGPTNFELRHKGVPIDPSAWLKKAGK